MQKETLKDAGIVSIRGCKKPRVLLETSVWLLGVHTATGLSLPPSPFSDESHETVTCKVTHVHTHVYNSTRSSLSVVNLTQIQMDVSESNLVPCGSF